jgi:hypothetical protein
LNEKPLSLSYLTLVWPMLLFQFDHILSLQILSSIISSLVQSKCMTSIPVFSVFPPKTLKELCSYTFNQVSNSIVIIISISYSIRDLHVKNHYWLTRMVPVQWHLGAMRITSNTFSNTMIPSSNDCYDSFSTKGTVDSITVPALDKMSSCPN